MMYKELEGTLIWSIVDRAIQNLVDNQDLEEKTDRRYLIGYLITHLNKNKCLNSDCLRNQISGEI